MVDRMLVPFEGDGSGVDDLSWGQHEIFRAMQRQQSWLPIGAAMPLAEGASIEDVADRLRFIMSRYPTARTRLRFDPDGPKQVVHSSGEAWLEIVDAPEGADPARVAAEVEGRLRDAPYDFVADWPVRTAVIRQGGVPTHQVTVLCHLVTDGGGAMVLLSELAQRDPVTGAARRPVTALTPLEQVHWQRSPSGRRTTEMALRRWEGILRTIPARRFPGSARPRRPRHWEGHFTSAAMHLAMPAITRRTRADTSPVLLASFAMALARCTGIQRVVLQVVVGNRFRAGLTESVSPVNQTGLCVLDVAGLSLDEAVAHTRRRTMAAYKYAYYDPRRMDELVARVGRERGEAVDIDCYFNDRRVDRPDRSTAPVASPRELERALAETEFRWDRRLDTPFEPMFLHVSDLPDRVVLTICGDTHYVAPDDMEAYVRQMEAIVVAAAGDPDPAADPDAAPNPAPGPDTPARPDRAGARPAVVPA